MLTLDHIAVACTDLAEGTAWAEERLGVKMQTGGKHARYGTHNTLLGLADGLYFEVIAIDPDRGILTRGDSLQTPDPWWQPSEYLGTLSAIRRHDEERPAPHDKTHLRILAFVRVLRHINWTRKRVFNS